MLEHIKEIDLATWTGEPQNNVKHYKNIPGVWFLLGREKKEKEHTSLVCLQTAKSKNDIGGEMETDIFLLKKGSEGIGFEKDYVNQFGEFMFSYTYISRQEMLYREIVKRYDDLTFVCIPVRNQQKLVDIDSLLKDIERYIAYRTSCFFWVNGGQYKRKESEEFEKNKQNRKNECPGLLDGIKSQYRKIPEIVEIADSLKEFLDKLMTGDIDDLVPSK